MWLAVFFPDSPIIDGTFVNFEKIEENIILNGEVINGEVQRGISEEHTGP